MWNPEVSVIEGSGDSRLSFHAVLLPVLSAITMLLCIPPFIWHAKHRNLAASVLIVWIIILNLFNVINAILWPTDDTSKWWIGVGLCDVEIRFLVACSVGVAGALACIMRSLANVMNTDRASLVPSRAQRRRGMIFNIFFCFICPILLTLAHLIVQDNRYDIFAISGCAPNNDSSWVSVLLVFIWPPVLSFLDAYYCSLVIIRLRRYRRQFSEILVCSNTNKSQFYRLFIISTVLILVFLPIQLYVFYVNVNVPLNGFSFSRIHGASWSQILMIPTGGVVRFDRWVYVAAGLLVFFFFGLGRDAVAMYRGWLGHIGLLKYLPACFQPTTRRLLPSTTSSGNSLGSTIALKAKHAIWRSFSRNPSFPGPISSEHELVSSDTFGSPPQTIRQPSVPTADDKAPKSVFGTATRGRSHSNASDTSNLLFPLRVQQKRAMTSIRDLFPMPKRSESASQNTSLPAPPARLPNQTTFLADLEDQSFGLGLHDDRQIGVSTQIRGGGRPENFSNGNRNDLVNNSVIVQTQVQQSSSGR